MISGLSDRREKQIGDAVVLSTIILKVLVLRGIIGKSEALAKLGEIARKGDWLGRPIYRYAMRYFDCGFVGLVGMFSGDVGCLTEHIRDDDHTGIFRTPKFISRLNITPITTAQEGLT